MTFTEFTLYVIEYDRIHHKQRSGQAAYNALWEARPDIADRVRGTKVDPFYEDRRLLAFWNFVQAEWAVCRQCGWSEAHHDAEREDTHAFDPEPAGT